MGVPVPGIEAADDSTAEALLSSLKTISAAERRKHANVFNYWLSIRGNRQFPPIRDLDPLEISDAGPFSVLLEMIGGGEDADIRHLGQAIKAGVEAEKVGAAPYPSLLSCIANKLPIVAATRQAFAFEDEFTTADATTRCWVTLLPFSATGAWIDYVYGFVSLDPLPGAEATKPEQADVEELEPAPVSEEVIEPSVELSGDPDEIAPAEEAAEAAPPAPTSLSGKPGFSAKLFESLASVGGFYGRVVEIEPKRSGEPARSRPDEPKSTAAAEVEVEVEVESGEPCAAAEEEAESSLTEIVADASPEVAGRPVEGPLQSKLTDIRAKADEARMAKLRANAALYEGLSAAYDFALDAEDNAEEYLKLVEAQGLKVQLRSPMKPVVKLAFDGMCDDSTIAQLEAVLAWALKSDLPRGSLADRIEAEGGIAPLLKGEARAA